MAKRNKENKSLVEKTIDAVINGEFEERTLTEVDTKENTEPTEETDTENINETEETNTQCDADSTEETNVDENESIDDVINECTGEIEKSEPTKKVKEHWLLARGKRISDYYNW